jgi:phage-related protein
MARTVAYHGARFAIAYAKQKDGACPAFEFFNGLKELDRTKLMALFRIAGDHGNFYNPEKFGDLGAGLYEFKSFQIRMPFAYAKNERGLVLITHGFIKQKHKTPKEEIARAWRIFDEDQARTRLAIVRKAQR